jgi:DNA-binding MarR family transcriptional regulator
MGKKIDNDAVEITRKLLSIGTQIMSLARDVAAPASIAKPSAPSITDALAHDSDLWLPLAQEIYSERQRRQDCFQSDLFGEPAWDILLDLYIAAKQSKDIQTTSACVGANVPPTTALRWLTLLETRGLVERYEDPKDQRRTFVRLSLDGYARMTKYFHDNRATLLTIATTSKPAFGGLADEVAG